MIDCEASRRETAVDFWAAALGRVRRANDDFTARYARCIGAGKWDNDGPPGERACDSGFYTAEILDVATPPQTNMVWDGVSPENGIILDSQQP
jgi:hypothetical protein